MDSGRPSLPQGGLPPAEIYRESHWIDTRPGATQGPMFPTATSIPWLSPGNTEREVAGKSWEEE